MGPFLVSVHIISFQIEHPIGFFLIGTYSGAFLFLTQEIVDSNTIFTKNISNFLMCYRILLGQTRVANQLKQ